MPETPEPTIIVDVWFVSEDSHAEFMQALVGLFERLRALEGFLDGQILEGVEPTRFVSYATMRSARDRDAAFLDSEVRTMMRAIGGIAHPSPHSYRTARTFTPAQSRDSAG
jgi:hypothetical protein